MANYRKLITNIIQDGARSTKWDVVIPALTSTTTINEECLSLLAKDITLPSLSLKPITRKFKGRDIPIAGQVTMSNDFDITFLVDENHNIRKYFEEWILKFDSRGYQSSIVNKKLEETLRKQFNNDSDLYKDITLYQYPFDAVIEPGTTAMPTATYVMYGCFPTGIGSFSYGNDSESLLDLKVSFTCSYYERIYKDQSTS